MAKRKPSNINLLFAVDKPAGCTSHDVVARARRALGERRIGHAGTLDPLATGVMLLGVGQATRLLGMLTLERKSYIAAIAFGAETNTDDAEGEVTRTAPCPSELADETFARKALEGFLGSQMQVPPAFSAISVNGVRAYKSAREGVDVELPARPVEVYEAALLSIDAEGDSVIWNVAFTVSKGTYIRSLARDIGRRVGSAAHISALRRTASGAVTLGDALALEDLSVEHVRARALDPLALLGAETVHLAPESLDDLLCGKRIPVSAALDPASSVGMCGLVVLGELRALADEENGYYQMRNVFPQGIEGVK